MRRALILGSQTFGLRAVLHDAARTAAALREHGFEISECVGASATREGILGAYDGFVAATRSEDVALVYYSGHGGVLINPDPARGGPERIQFIVPHDYTADPGDFRGILAQELSYRLARLAARTSNVAVILDCCHAARMSRAAAAWSLVPRALPSPARVGLRAWRARLGEAWSDLGNLPPTGNATVVRLAACGSFQSAYEYEGAGGAPAGVLTESFVLVLREFGGCSADGPLPVTWRSLCERVRERVLRITQIQRPEIEGPAARFVFGTDKESFDAPLPIRYRPGGYVLLGGSLAMVNPGDEYVVLPLGTRRGADSQAVARARVLATGALESRVALSFVGPARAPEDVEGLPAYLVARAARKMEVRVQAPGAVRDAIAREIDACPLLTSHTDTDPRRAMPSVVIEAGTLRISDRDGLLRAPLPYRAEDIPRVVDDLRRLAVAEAVRALDSGTGIAPSSVGVEVGIARKGAREPLPPQGTPLMPGDAVYVRLTNVGRRTLYFHVFSIGVDHDVVLLTPDEPSGIRVPPDGERIIGIDDGEVLVGLPLFWPEDLPREGMRREDICVIVTERPHDLRAIETGGAPGAARAPESELEALMRTIGQGGTRGVEADTARVADSFLALQRTFSLAPFLVDEHREVPETLVPEGRSEQPERCRLAIVLTDLVLNDAAALLGDNVRVDALVITGAEREGRTCAVETRFFAPVRHGERLPVDDLPLYVGPASHFVEWYVWLSRTDAHERSLAELLATRMSPSETSAATAGMTTLARVAYDVLTAACGVSIGVCRSTHLASHRFCAGVHPEHGRHRAQTVSFRYRISAVD